jgi:hypothetical protein
MAFLTQCFRMNSFDERKREDTMRRKGHGYRTIWVTITLSFNRMHDRFRAFAYATEVGARIVNLLELGIGYAIVNIEPRRSLVRRTSMMIPFSSI